MAEKRPTVGIYTLGCKVNQYESEAIAEGLSDMGFDILAPTRACDAYVINTCTVTAESDRKARQFIRRAIKKNPSAYIAVTGCLAHTGAESLAAIGGVDVIIGNDRKLLACERLRSLVARGSKNEKTQLLVGDLDTAPFEQMNIKHFDRTRAYVKIEDGCENRCTYCIIPAARGKVRSKQLEDVLSEVRTLTEGGCREVVLTGIETASYGKDIYGHSRLGELLFEVDKIDGIGRVRLGSLDPSLIRPEFVDRISTLGSLAPHFHLSLQSGCSRILALMRRRYNAEQAMAAIELLRSRIEGVQLTTDVIVGFPGETEEDFAETCEFLDRARFLTAHIFTYSKRAGTPAAEMRGQIPEDIKTKRLHILEGIVARRRVELLSGLVDKGVCRQVLFETERDGMLYGHTAEFIEVAVKGDIALRGEFAEVRFTSTDGNICFGELI